MTKDTEALREAVEQVKQLAQRDMARTQTDFLGRMGQELCDFEAAIEPYPDGELPDDVRGDAYDAISGLAGLAFAQMLMLRGCDHTIFATPASDPDTIGSHFGNGGGFDPAAGVAPALIEWITELARRDILRTQTDFIGRMHQAIGEFESICDDNPDGEFDEAARDDAGEALAGLAGLSLAQLAMVSDPADPIKQLAHPPQPTPVDPVAGGEALREAAQSVLDMMFSTYKARNGREVGVQGDDGEKVWLVHSDQIEDLRRALQQSPPRPTEALCWRR